MNENETMSDSEMRACLDHSCMNDALDSGTVDFRDAVWVWDGRWWVKKFSYASSPDAATERS